MKVIAIACEGKEFLYRANTAHKVSKASANNICKVLNDARYKLNPGEIWHVFEVSGWENAGIYAETQSFKMYRGRLQEIIGR